jgi:hypothetical protein
MSIDVPPIFIGVAEGTGIVMSVCFGEGPGDADGVGVALGFISCP